MPMIRATLDLDTCINALHRATANVERLKRSRRSSVQTRDLLSTGDAQTLKEVRHALEHVHDRFAARTLGEGDIFIPRLWPESIEFAGREISYRTLARWLERMQELAARLLEPKGSSTGR